jgi:hypothetical protein
MKDYLIPSNEIVFGINQPLRISEFPHCPLRNKIQYTDCSDLSTIVSLELHYVHI